MPIVSTVSVRALTELRIRILRLAYARDNADINERRIIEAVLQDELDLFLGGKRRQFLIDGNGAKIGNDEQNPFRLLTGVEGRV